MKKLWIALCSLVLLVSLVIPTAVSAETTLPIDESKLTNGLWYQDNDHPIVVEGYTVSFMKIYGLGTLSDGGGRHVSRFVMELSTYPRAYQDTDPHLYTVDTPFTVSQDDLNDYYNVQTAQDGGYQYRPEIADGTNVYVDDRQLVFLLGEAAKHYAGESLPGSFPLWLPSETLPTPSWVDSKNSVFPYVFACVKGQLVSTILHNAEYSTDGGTTWTVLPQTLFDQYKAVFTDSTSEVRVNKLVKNKDRIIVRILYDFIIQY
ncbi:MAG: hypothetical protein WC657_05510 [Candidatus Paceibacterota bacterium]|jgi:hypothetical protein